MTKRKPHFVIVPMPSDGEFETGIFDTSSTKSGLRAGRQVSGGIGKFVTFGDEIGMSTTAKSLSAEPGYFHEVGGEATMAAARQIGLRSDLLESMIASGKAYDKDADVTPIMYEIIRTSRDRAYMDSLVSSIVPGAVHDHHAVMFLRLTSLIKDDLPSWEPLKDSLRRDLMPRGKKRAEKMMLGL